MNEQLVDAARRGQTEKVIELIRTGADIHHNDDEALRSASFRGFVETARALLSRGADVHANDEEALRLAIKREDVNMVLLLLSYGTRIDDDIMNDALGSENIELIGILIDRGATTIPFEALKRLVIWGSIDTIRFLINKGIDMTNDQFISAAMRSGELDKFQLIFDAVGEIADPFNFASVETSENIIRFLFQRGYRPKQKWLNHFFSEAVRKGYVDTARLLFFTGADLRWILHGDIFFSGDEEMVQFLINIGKDIVDDFFLMEAIDHGDLGVVRVLLENGARVTQAHITNAEDLDLFDILDLLREHIERPPFQPPTRKLAQLSLLNEGVESLFERCLP